MDNGAGNACGWWIVVGKIVEGFLSAKKTVTC